MPSNSVPFQCYGVLQIGFIIIIFSNFILTISFLVCETDGSTMHKGNIAKNETKKVSTDDLVLPLIIASSSMLVASCIVFYILVYQARTNDLVGNLHNRKRSASFKVALLSWILTGIETMLRLIGLFHYTSKALDDPDAPWWMIAGYHILVLLYRTFQIFCLLTYEKNARLRKEGPRWMITRKSFLIIIVFMNCYMWILNVANIKTLVSLTSKKMEEFLTDSVERILYTVNRASTLAYHVESIQLFYKFYQEDNDSILQQQYEELVDSETSGYSISEADSRQGAWGGFFLFFLLISMAGGSFLTRTHATQIHYLATAATIIILLTIFLITLNTTLSFSNCDIAVPYIQDNHAQRNGIQDNENDQLMNQDRRINMFEDIAYYMAGEKVGHLRILLFYSICAVSYHFLLTMKIIFTGFPGDVYQPVREGCKGLACISLTVFMFWMSHENRKLRCWRDMNVMLWTVLALVLLELIEETYEHTYAPNDSLQLYALPLAIDFKIYVLVHTYSDVVFARARYRLELRQAAWATTTVGLSSTRASTPSSFYYSE